MIKKSVMALTAMAVGVFVAGTTPSIAGEKEVNSLANKKAAIIRNMHKKASKALVNSAQDKVFSEFFGGDTAAKSRIDELELAVQSKFHVEEMCLITDKGHEVSRIVAAEIAPNEDLSTEEASAAFFAPSFAKKAKQAYISPVYMSPDVNKWVIAYVTPIVVDGKKAAILHYEHGLNTYQLALTKGVTGNKRVIAVNTDGYIVADSANKIGVAKVGEKEDPASYFKKLSGALAAAIKVGGKGKGSFSENGADYAVAYLTVENWTVAAVEKQ